MTKTRLNEKSMKTGKLLRGLRDARVASHLKPYGLTSKTLEHGWDLFLKASEKKLSLAVLKPAAEPRAFTDIDRFEDRWIPVAKIVLESQYPAIAETLFAGLSFVDSKSTAVSVAIFLDRLEAMREGAEPFGKNVPLAREYLRTRGLTDDIVAGALADRDKMQAVEETTAVGPDADAARAAEAAEAAMWAFYLEWSALARHAIKDGNLLRILGFKKRTGGRTPKAPEVVINSERTLHGSAPVPLLPAE